MYFTHTVKLLEASPLHFSVIRHKRGIHGQLIYELLMRVRMHLVHHHSKSPKVKYIDQNTESCKNYILTT